MKTILSTFTLAAAVLLLGCKTVGPEAMIQFVAARAGDAARVGIRADLVAHPEHRPAIEASLAALNGLIQSTNYSSATLRQALAALPIKELRGNYGALALEGAMLVFDFATMFAYDIQTEPAVLAVATQIRDGIAEALATPIMRSQVMRAPAPSAAKLQAKRIVRL